MNNTYIPLKDLMSTDRLFPQGDLKTLKGMQYIYASWYKVNGDFERTHTTGLFLKKPQGKEALPTLIVYIDKHILLQDFRTNKNIYMIRLKTEDIQLQDIQFHLSHTDQHPLVEKTQKKAIQKCCLPELTEEEITNIHNQVSCLTGSIKDTVLRAMVLSVKRQKSLQTHEDI